jgi:hypothetical protein
MDHILGRHHTAFWDGSVKATQSFFERGISAQKVEEMIVKMVRSTESSILENGMRSSVKVDQEIEGVIYRLTIDNGHVVQFYPHA